jgi:hypothetical protein
MDTLCPVSKALKTVTAVLLLGTLGVAHPVTSHAAAAHAVVVSSKL